MSGTSDKQSKEVDFDKLKFIRVFTPMHVPKGLIEQVREREYEVDDWYAYQDVICMRQTDNGPQLNPLSMLYVIADDDNKVVGVLWCEVAALEKALMVQTFSMDKRYWLRGKAVSLAAEKAKEIMKECKLRKIAWFTSYPKHSERYGFKRAKSVHMEYMEKEDGRSNGRELETRGECPVDDRRTERAIGTISTGDGAASESGAAAVLATV